MILRLHRTFVADVGDVVVVVVRIGAAVVVLEAVEVFRLVGALVVVVGDVVVVVVGIGVAVVVLEAVFVFRLIGALVVDVGDVVVIVVAVVGREGDAEDEAHQRRADVLDDAGADAAGDDQR